MKNKFGTEIKRIELEQVLDAYNAVSDSKAKAETEWWIKEAAEVVEPSTSDIFKSCKLALALENLLDADTEKLWKNWSSGLHRVTCYGDITEELGFFCRFKEIKMVNEAV